MTKDDDVKPEPRILEIEPYKGGRAQVHGVAEPVKLSSNENPFGPSRKAVEAFQKAAMKLHRYPNSDHTALRAAIGKYYDLPPDQIVCGNGSDELLHLIAQAYSGPKGEVVYTEHGFLMYKIASLAAGAKPVVAKERERTTDVDAVLAAVTPKTRIVFIANPNNPTGTMIGGNELRRLADALPKSVLLVLDSAYAEFEPDHDGGASLIAEGRKNIVMTRTFSKLFGLGGVRVGWAYAHPDIIDAIMRIRGPFNLSEPQQAAAIAALADEDHIERTLSETARLRVWLAKALAEVGVPSDPSHANFILARFKDAAEAEACDAFLQKEGLIVRGVASYGLPHCLRITIGDEASCRRVAHAVAQFKGKVKEK
jgi:histidinol-phosphate aminotransferase